MESETMDTASTKQLSGRKKKKLFTKLKTQMEFYFSDSNLARDNFLQKLIEKDPEGYVDLEVFKTFNKIKELTENVSLIADALSKSEILELNSQKTRVRRSTPLGEPKDFDACTIYVEKLFPNADIKWVKSLFEKFGLVDYVNIPRFKHSNKIKGFAFVEFKSPESVIKACEYYNQPYIEPAPGIEMENAEQLEDENEENRETEKGYQKKETLNSILTAEEIMKNATAKSISETFHTSHIKTDKSTSKTILSSEIVQGKRKHEHGNSDRHAKVLKTSCEEHDNDSHEVIVKGEILEKNDSVNECQTGETIEKSKKKRKHKRKRHEASEQPLLRVMSKYEWKSYRNKYLALQRSTMSHIKKHILLQSREWREQESLTKSENSMESPRKGLQFQPGVILKVLLGTPIENAADLKEKVKAHASVAYTDASLGHSEIFIRCHKPEDAQHILQEKKFDFLGSVEVLKGNPEETYWKKIEEDRKLKFSIPLTHKKRGRDKIIAKATKLAEQKNKHIFFNE